MSSSPPHPLALFSALLLGASPAAADPQRSTARSIDHDRYPFAVCNNGGAATYDYRLSTDAGAGDDGIDHRKKWLVVLSGGGTCTSYGTCVARWAENWNGPNLDGGPGNHFNMVPNPGAIDFNGHGILDFDGEEAQRPDPGIVGEHDNPFRGPAGDDGFNRIWVNYCSSDLWQGLGTQVPVDPLDFPAMDFDPGQPALDRLHFGGARIVDAVISLIMRGEVESGGRKGYDADLDRIPDDLHGEIVIAGSSAGGNGTIRNLDTVAWNVAHGVLNEYEGAPGVRVYGVADAATSVGVYRREVGDTQAAAFYAGGDPTLVRNDDDCQDDEDHRCYSINVLVRDEISTPIFVVQQAFDSVIHDSIKAGIAAAIRHGAGELETAYPGLADLLQRRLRNADAAAEAYIRWRITAQAPSIGVLRGNLAGLFIPNYATGWHQLMADSERFYTSEAHQWEHGRHPGSPRLGPRYEGTAVSIPTALGVFRRCVLGAAGVAGRNACVGAIDVSDPNRNARVVNSTALPR